MQRYAREILSALDLLLDDRSGLSVRLLTPPIADEDVPALRNIRHEVVGRRSGHAWEQIDLPRHVSDSILFCPGNTAPVQSLFGTTKVVVTVHDLSYLYFPNAYSFGFKFLYNRLIPLILRKADAVITVSQSERDSILRLYPFAESKLVAIQNGGLPVGIGEQFPVPTDEPTVLYVGSLSKRKNFPAMLEVAIRLARSRGSRFAFVGSAPPGLTATLAEVPGDIRDRIHFHGQINDWNVLLEIYRSARCLLFPSLYEASPLPPIEAMGCGCPVIASTIPSLVERCGDAARYCDPRDIDSIASAVEDLLDDTALCQKLRAAGYAQADRYSWAHCTQATLNVILSQG